MENPKPKILVVDDEANVLFTMSSILRQEGYDVTGVTGGEAAIQSIRETQYDLVLTDLNMPGVNGLGVLAEVQKRSPNTVTVMITGYGSLDSALEAIQLGAYEYLLKPTEVADLKAAVRRSLERKRLSEIDTLYRAGSSIARSLDVEEISAEACRAATSVLGIASVCVVTFGREAVSNCPTTLREVFSDGAVLERLRAGSVITNETQAALPRAWAAANGVASYALVPGLASGHLACVLSADNGSAPFDFHPSALRFLQALADQAALALENALLVAQLKRNNQELEAANQKLRELDQLKSQFLSVATHELRTPLSIILGYNAMLAETLEGRLGEEERVTLEESVAACKRLIRLVNSMLDITQIETGKMQMNYAFEDLRQMVAAVIGLFQHEARSRGLRLHQEVPARLPRLEMDGERIQQVLINLVGNAVKFTPTGGSVTIAVRLAKEAVQISVRDTGIGISQGDQQRIFDEFAQVRRSARERQRDGSGLGLAIARRIVEAHGGGITVESAPGTGSTFTFSLPVKARRQTATGALSA